MGGGGSYDVGKSEIWCPGFPPEKVPDTFPPLLTPFPPAEKVAEKVPDTFPLTWVSKAVAQFGPEKGT